MPYYERKGTFRMTLELDDAFAWYCAFMDAQGADHPDTFAALSPRRQHILETMVNVRVSHEPRPPRARTAEVTPLRDRLKARRAERRTI